MGVLHVNRDISLNDNTAAHKRAALNWITIVYLFTFALDFIFLSRTVYLQIRYESIVLHYQQRKKN